MSIGLGVAMGAAAEQGSRNDLARPRSAGVRLSSGRGKKKSRRRSGGESPMDSHRRTMAAHDARKAEREAEADKKKWDSMSPEQRRAKLESDVLSYDGLKDASPKEKLALLDGMDKREQNRRSAKANSAKAARSVEKDELDLKLKTLQLATREREESIAQQFATARTEAEQQAVIRNASELEKDIWRNATSLLEAGNDSSALRFINESTGAEGTKWESVERGEVDQYGRPTFILFDEETGRKRVLHGRQLKGASKKADSLESILGGAGIDPAAPALPKVLEGAKRGKPLPDGRIPYMSADGNTIYDQAGNIIEQRK